MKSKRICLIIGGIAIIACLVSAGVFVLYQWSSTLEFTVQATLYVPSDKDSLGDSDGYKPYRIPPNRTVNVEDYREYETGFKQDKLNIDFYYGSMSISGSFPLSELKAHWENILIEQDWPFRVYLFNTNEHRAFQVCLDLEIYADTAQAKAALQVYLHNRPYCETLNWTGRIGEEIVFICEV